MMRALVVPTIFGILKKFTSLLRLQPPQMFMNAVICAFLQYLQLKPCPIIHQSFDDQQMQKQSITIGSWQVLGKFNVMARAGNLGSVCGDIGPWPAALAKALATGFVQVGHLHGLQAAQGATSNLAAAN